MLYRLASEPEEVHVKVPWQWREERSDLFALSENPQKLYEK